MSHHESIRNHGPADAGRVLPDLDRFAGGRVRIRFDHRHAYQDGHPHHHGIGRAAHLAVDFAKPGIADFLRATAVPDH